MDDCSEFALKKLCCTCLSCDRKLSQLCRLKDGINNLYLILSQDSEAYREGFFKDTASWHICWECWAIMKRISNFQNQACIAQRQLSDIAEGRTDLKHLNTCLSQLRYTHKSSYDQNIVIPDSIADNFIDCGPDFRNESDEDIPLSLLHTNVASDRIHSDDEMPHNGSKDVINKPLSKKELNKTADTFKKKKKTETLVIEKDLNGSMYNDCFSITKMNDVEMNDSRSKRKSAVSNASFKCESCAVVFENQICLDRHIVDSHTEKDKHKQCYICLVYVKKSTLTAHRDSHYVKYECKLCENVTYTIEDIFKHLEDVHAKNNINVSKDDLKNFEYPLFMDSINIRRPPWSSGLYAGFHGVADSRGPGFESQWGQIVDGSPWYPKPDDTICSEHFMGNKKSDEEENPSYAPTIFPEIYRKRKVNDSQVLARYTRLTKRRTTKVSDTTSSQIIIEEGSELNQTQPFMIDQGCQVNMFSESKLRDTTFICIRLIYSDHCDPTSRILMTNNSRKKDKSCGTDKKSYEDQSTETKSQEFVGISSITNDQELLDPSGVSFSNFEFLLTRLTMRKCTVSTKDRLLIFLIKMKTGLTFSALSVLFGVQKNHNLTYISFDLTKSSLFNC
ncbi:hypothetical protein evm_009315 [Chilo suppressalis]|nr:hypothetical protein evm_009315 [Chilo suppressalis]